MPCTSLPPLSPPDHHLLSRLLALNENYPALAAELAAPPSPRLRGEDRTAARGGSGEGDAPASGPPSDLLGLMSWSTRPHITAWLTHYHTLQDQSSRRAAITALESLLKTSTNPVESRRTATTLLRALDHKWPTERPRPRPASPPSPRWRGEDRLSAFRGESGEGSDAPPSPRLPAPVTSPSHPTPVSPAQAPPRPSLTPSLSLTPTDLAQALVKDLSSADLLQTAATLAAISTPSLCADADTVIAHLEPFLALPASTPLSPPQYHKPTPPARHACTLTLSHASHTLTLTFTRAHNAPWLIAGIDST